ncbi:MAG: response regulator [Phycisphaerae bacterium]|nr:response regulator [Phycisphaerae bacterium]
MQRPLNVLIVEDSEDDAMIVLRELRRGGFDPTWRRVDSASSLGAAMVDGRWDLIVADYNMPGFDAIRALEQVRAQSPDLPFIIVSGAIGEDVAVEAMRAGANDYVMKERLGRLVPAVERELREAETRRQSRRAEAERAELEGQLRRSQRMESIGRLAGGIAHDFNNLLSPILGYADIALMDLAPDHPLYTALMQIRGAAERARGLTRQLLAFGRKQMLEVKVIDLGELVSGFERMLRRTIREDITIELRIDAKGGCVFADPSQIEQVLMNLAVNAQDAMPNGGKLVIETGTATLTEDDVRTHAGAKCGSYIVLSALDTGCGMDAPTQERIFEPFFTTKPPGQGTGLGLSTVYGIVKQHGGHIRFESRPESGTVFRVFLPQAEGPPEHLAAPSVSQPGKRGNETVLVVEDDESVRGLVHQMLRSHGYDVHTAGTPEEAFRFVARSDRPPDLLLTDVIMPEMNGPELYETLAKSRPELAVLYMSGYSDEVIAHHGGIRRGIHLLAKPFSVETLTNKVREVLDGRAGSGHAGEVPDRGDAVV